MTANPESPDKRVTLESEEKSECKDLLENKLVPSMTIEFFSTQKK
jgi:hypothetical protein